MTWTYRHFKTHLLDNGICIVGFEYQGRSVNVLTSEALEEVKAVVHDVTEDERVKGIVLVSLKDSFIAGADACGSSSPRCER